MAGLFAVSAAAVSVVSTTSPSYTQYVDMSIGTGGHGHVFMGANVPFGAVQLGPTSIPQTWDWVSGYHQSDTTVIGFAHTHLNGTGIGDLSDVSFMPVVGDVTLARGVADDPKSGMWSTFSHSNERFTPGYYSTHLDRYGIDVELTATKRVGFHKYTFPAKADARVVVDLENGTCWDNPTEAHVERVDATTISGYRYSSGWANAQRIYFVAKFSEPIADIIVSRSEGVSDKGEKRIKVYATLKFGAMRKPLYAKVAISPVSCQNAELNMQQELPHWNFKSTVKAADAAWNAELSKIDVQTSDATQRKIFYTALYHTMIAPSLFCDVNGDYRGADGNSYNTGGGENYSTFSLWDTYRAAHPLMSIIHPEKMPDMINTMLRIYRQQGKLPVWHLAGCETDCMVGNPGVSVVADAVTKGYGGFDKELAFEAMKRSVMLDERGQDLRKKYGYIPCDIYGEAVANDMEYAIADGALARAAESLGRSDDAAYFRERSHSYRRFFDPSDNFIKGVTAAGEFRKPFNPFFAAHRENDYCEGNAWQYTWLAPHDVGGLVNLFGGRRQALKVLDSLFEATTDLGDNASPDMSGMIGQYVHGNEPSHHILYLYTMLGEPWKCADRVREVLTTLYRAEPDGLSGNEDVGQMSAWYILSSMGFYQVEPAGGRYYFGSPLIDKATIKVADGVFTVLAKNNSSQNRYIQRVRLNGKPYSKEYIDFSDIRGGGVLEFEMGDKRTLWYVVDDFKPYVSQRPEVGKRLFSSPTIEREIERVTSQLTNKKLAWMFANCFPNTLETTVHARHLSDGRPDTFVYTGDIHAMWLRDSGAQVYPYVQFADRDKALSDMIAGVVNRQMMLINIDPYANAFNDGVSGAENKSDVSERMPPEVFERKWEIDSHCYPIRLAYALWKSTGRTDIFAEEWVEAMRNIYSTLREQQRKGGEVPYSFLRTTDRQLDTKCVRGYGSPIRPVGLIASAFRPSDDATTFEFLVPSNFFAVTSLRKAAEILESVNHQDELAQNCRALADEVEQALREYAVVDHPKYGKIYAYEVDGFGNRLLMDDANVPSLLAMAYLGDVAADDPIYQNTRRFVWSEDNPFFFRGDAGEGIGSPHIGYQVIWPMSIMMRAFTSTDDEQTKACILQLLNTDNATGFIHESFHKDDASDFTREWFAWQNTLFGELILKLVNEGRVDLLNEL